MIEVKIWAEISKSLEILVMKAGVKIGVDTETGVSVVGQEWRQGWDRMKLRVDAQVGWEWIQAQTKR